MYRHRNLYREEQSNSESIDRWLVSYADYVTLMFALFVVLYAIAINKEEQYKTISDTLSKVFEKPVAEQTGVKGDSVLTDNQPHSDFEQFGTSLEPPAGPEIVADAKEKPTLTRPQYGNPLVSLQEQLTKSLANLIEQGVAKVESDEDWLTIQLNSGLLFASGSAVATQQSGLLLQEITKILNQSNNVVRVRGYTDNQVISNEIFDSNWELSMARATAILKELQKLGVKPERLAAEGYGEFSPFADNSTAEGRAENRKVVIAISKLAVNKVGPTATPAEASSVTEAQQILQQDDQAVLEEAKPEQLNVEYAADGTIQIIQLPNGGLKITSAPQATNQPAQQPKVQQKQDN